MTTSRIIGRGITNLLQEDNEMLTGSLQVNEISGVTEIKYYDFNVTESDQQGYQRPLARRRINSMANGFETSIQNGSFLPIPTSIILSDRGVNYKVTKDGTIDLISGRFKIIDGQHRTESFKEVVNRFEHLTNFPTNYMPIVILCIEKLDLTPEQKIDLEIQHFTLINETAKKVPVDLALHLRSWRRNNIKDSHLTKAQINAVICNDVVDKLNAECAAWNDKIIMPAMSKYNREQCRLDETKIHRRIVKSTSLVNSLKPVLFTLETTVWERSNPSVESKIKMLFSVVNAFWGVIYDRMPEGSDFAKDHVLLKSTGAFSMHHLLARLIRQMAESGSFKKADFAKFLKKDVLFLNSSYWLSNPEEGMQKGEATKYGNMSGFKELSVQLYNQINDEQVDESELLSQFD